MSWGTPELWILGQGKNHDEYLMAFPEAPAEYFTAEGQFGDSLSSTVSGSLSLPRVQRTLNFCFININFIAVGACPDDIFPC